MNANENQIIVYQPNKTVRLDVRLENETVWLNRHQMAQLFGRDVKTIGKHIANALSEELACSSVVADFATTQRQQNPTSAKFAQVEVTQNPTVANFATVQQEGGREVVRKVEYYSLDVILSVGYRVKSVQGILFRRWANTVLKISPADIATFNSQYPKLAVRYNETFHDRFLIIDDKELYLIGASLKDLGSKCFAFTKLDPADIRRIKKTAFAIP